MQAVDQRERQDGYHNAVRERVLLALLSASFIGPGIGHTHNEYSHTDDGENEPPTRTHLEEERASSSPQGECQQNVHSVNNILLHAVEVGQGAGIMVEFLRPAERNNLWDSPIRSLPFEGSSMKGASFPPHIGDMVHGEQFTFLAVLWDSQWTHQRERLW